MIFSNLMTFGDADNDLEMIEAAAQGIVMETDFLTLKQWQRAITDTNDNDGVAKYCERYFATLFVIKIVIKSKIKEECFWRKYEFCS